MRIKIIMGALLLLSLFSFTGCLTTPRMQEAKFKVDYVNYDENPIIDFSIYNPAETSFEGAVQITAVVSSGYFNCFEPANKNISTILPKKNYNGDIEIISMNNTDCKGKDFDVYLNLNDFNSNDRLGSTKLLLHIKG